MKTYTLADIRALNPCYDPARHLPEDWQGTIADGLRLTDAPAEDRIWVATRLLDDRTNRLFAVWCARQALMLIDNPDPRSVAACDVAERFANGEATQRELDAARVAARGAARGTVRDAARGAARGAAWDAARGAARAAAEATAEAAARVTARVTARGAARDAQIEQLIKMVEGNKHENV